MIQVEAICRGPDIDIGIVDQSRHQGSHWIQRGDIDLPFVDFGRNEHDHAHHLKGRRDEFQWKPVRRLCNHRVAGCEAERIHDNQFHTANDKGHGVARGKAPVQNVVRVHDDGNDAETAPAGVHDGVEQPRVPPVPFRRPAIVNGQHDSVIGRLWVLLLSAVAQGQNNSHHGRRKVKEDVRIEIESQQGLYQRIVLLLDIEYARHNGQTKETKQARRIRQAANSIPGNPMQIAQGRRYCCCCLHGIVLCVLVDWPTGCEVLH